MPATYAMLAKDVVLKKSVQLSASDLDLRGIRNYPDLILGTSRGRIKIELHSIFREGKKGKTESIEVFVPTKSVVFVQEWPKGFQPPLGNNAVLGLNGRLYVSAENFKNATEYKGTV